MMVDPKEMKRREMLKKEVMAKMQKEKMMHPMPSGMMMKDSEMKPMMDRKGK